MIDFKEILQEKNISNILKRVEKEQKNIPLYKRLKGKSEEYLYQYKNKWIIDTKHSAERYLERSNTSVEQIKYLFQKVINYLTKNNSSSKEYLFYSKSLNQGIVIDYRPDGKSKSEENQVVIITVLPQGKSTAKSGTEKVVVEAYKNGMFSQEFINYIYEIGQTNLQEQVITEGQNEVIVEGLDNFEFYFVDKKVWDVVGYNVVEID
jgi:hypothetical protein